MTWAVVVVAVGLAVVVALLARALFTARSDAVNAEERITTLASRVEELEAELAASVEPVAVEPPVAAPAPDVVPDKLDGDMLVAALPQTLADPATGLFNEAFFRVTLETRVSAARRHLRPVSVVLLQVAQGVRDGDASLASPTIVAGSIKVTLRDADTACHLDDGRFAMILEDTPENGAVWTVERVRRALVGERPNQTLWAGIACYPAHAFDAWELFDRAGRALESAREWRQDRIEIATAD